MTTASSSLAKILPYCSMRNPRNLERLRYARKNAGFGLDADRGINHTYYYKACFDRSHSDHLEANLFHYADGCVLSSSTLEWPICRELYRTNDTSAASNLGRLFAERCLRAGVSHVMPGWTSEEQVESAKVKAFAEGLASGGVVLEELETIPKPDPRSVGELEYSREVEELITEADLVEPEKKRGKKKRKL